VERSLKGQLFVYNAPFTAQNIFYRYDLTDNSWDQMADITANIDYGSDIIDGGGDYLYATQGGSTTNFYRYTISLNIWESLAVTPYAMYVGGGLTKIGNYIYGLPGSTKPNIIKYDIVAGTWSDLGSLNTGSISHGGTITSDATRYIYITPSDRSASTGSRLVRYDTTNGALTRLCRYSLSCKCFWPIAFTTLQPTVCILLPLAPRISCIIGRPGQLVTSQAELGSRKPMT